MKIARVLYNFTKDVEETIYLCRTIVRWLCGHDSFVDFFYIWGEGGSGKDFLWRVLCSLFNDEEDGYAVGESGDMITDMKSGFKESASPTLMSWMGKRLITFTEVADKPLDIDAIKPLTEQRGVKKKGRKLYQGPEAFHPTFGMLATSQWPAKIVRPDDSGAARRLKMWMTTQIFKEKPDANNPNHQKADETLHQEVVAGKHALSLFWLVVYAYDTLADGICARGEILPIPQRIRDDTEGVFVATQGVDIATWLKDSCAWCPRGEAAKGKDLLTELCVAACLEQRAAKAALVKAGAVETANGVNRIWVYRHPMWLAEVMPPPGTKLPGLKLV